MARNRANGIGWQPPSINGQHRSLAPWPRSTRHHQGVEHRGEVKQLVWHDEDKKYCICLGHVESYTFLLREGERQTDRQTNTQTNRQIATQTHTCAHTHRHRQTQWRLHSSLQTLVECSNEWISKLPVLVRRDAHSKRAARCEHTLTHWSDFNNHPVMVVDQPWTAHTHTQLRHTVIEHLKLLQKCVCVW